MLTDLICTAAPAIDIVTIDTGPLPEETLTLLERLERRYQRRIQALLPRAAAVERYVREHGINGFYNGLAAAPQLLPDPQDRALPARHRRLWRVGHRSAP